MQLRLHRCISIPGVDHAFDSAQDRAVVFDLMPMLCADTLDDDCLLDGVF